MHTPKDYENLTDLFNTLDLSEAQARVHRESRARIVLAGPVHAGKSSLYNCLQGWEVSAIQHDALELHAPAEESLGLFTLIDLPNPESRPDPMPGYGFPYGYDDERYGEPAYFTDHWPMQEPALWSLASRLIRQSALLCGLLGAEPVPLLDVPFQLLTQMQLVMRLAAMYGRASVNSARVDGLGVSAGSGLSTAFSGAGRGVMVTLLSGLGLRYLAQQLVKLLPGDPKGF